MIRQLARVSLIAILAGFLIPNVVLANPPSSHMAVRCWDFDPNFPTAEGALTFDPVSNSLDLVLDFMNSPLPSGPPPGTPVTLGHLFLTCDNPLTGPLNYNTSFSGVTGMYGWDFETTFTHVLLPSAPGGTESCFNPRVDLLDFQLDGGTFYQCGVGYLGIYDPFAIP